MEPVEVIRNRDRKDGSSFIEFGIISEEMEVAVDLLGAESVARDVDALPRRLTLIDFRGILHAPANVEAVKLCGCIPDAPVQIGSDLADDTAAEDDSSIEIAVVGIRFTLHIFCPHLCAQVNVEADADVGQFVPQDTSIDVAGVRDEDKIVIVVKVIVRNVLEDMERSQVFPGISESHNVLQFEVGFNIVSIDEELYLVHEMSHGLVEGRGKGVNFILSRHHPHKNLFPDTQFRGIVSGSDDVLRGFLGRHWLLGKIELRLKVITVLIGEFSITITSWTHEILICRIIIWHIETQEDSHNETTHKILMFVPVILLKTYHLESFNHSYILIKCIIM